MQYILSLHNTSPETSGLVPFLPRDSVPKDFDLGKEGVSFGRCHSYRRLPNDLADGQSGCKYSLKGDSTRLNQACKKEVSFVTFLSKRKVKTRVDVQHS